MTTEIRHPLFARLWVRLTAQESAEEIAHRRETLAGLSGRVVELGAGAGSNFAHYPEAVTHVVAVEPEPHLRAAAQQAAATAPVPVEVVDAVAGAVALEDGSCDAAVACLVLCSVPDQAAALADLRRVLRPGGELRFFEHVHAERQPLRAFLSFADRSTLWPRIAGGCHPARDTRSAIEAAGFAIAEIRRFDFSPSRPMPAIPHILGRATRDG